MLTKIKELKDNYKLELSQKMDKFKGYFIVDFTSDALFLGEYCKQGSSFHKYSIEEKTIKPLFTTQKKIFRAIYVKDINSFVFNYVQEPELYVVDLLSKEIRDFSTESNIITPGPIKYNKGNVYALDTYGHVLLKYSFEGRLISVISFQEKFEFPIQFEFLHDSTTIVMTRFDDSFAQSHRDIYNKHKIGVNDYRTNLGVFDTKTESMILLPRLATKPGQFLYYIAHDEKNNIFINNCNTLFKLNPEFGVVYSADLHKSIYGYSDHVATFFQTFVLGSNLFISEINKYKTIYQYAI